MLITFADVQSHDVVIQKVGVPVTIVAAERVRVYGEDIPLVNLHYYMEGAIRAGFSGAPNEVIGLLHRPYPDGKSEQQMLAELRLAAALFAEKEMALEPLSQAMEAYELGKPLTEPTPETAGAF